MTAELSTSGDDFSVNGGKIKDVAAGVDPTDAANVSQIGGGGAPTTADYLVGTTQGGLSAEIVVGTTPGGELGGTWASPTVDASHSGSTHAAVQAAAEATAASALAAHTTDTSAAHAASAISADSTTLVGTGTDVQAVLEELDNGIADHLADTSAAHAASAVSVNSATLVGTGTDVQAVFEELDDAVATLVAASGVPVSTIDAKGDLLVGSANDAIDNLTVGANDTVLVADSGQTLGVKWAAVPGTSAFIPVSTIDAKGDLLAGTADDTIDNLTVGSNGKILTAASAQATGLLWDSGYLGGLELVYKYTVSGTDKASIDTGVDAALAGTNNWAAGDVLEIFFYARTDQAATTSTVTATVNNDTTSVYDRTFVNNTNATVTGGNSLGQAGWALGVAGATASTGTFTLVTLVCANYTGTVGNKQFDSFGGTLGQTAATATLTNQNFTWRNASPAAITRLKVIPATGGVLLKIGTQLLIYKRRNA